MKKTEMTTEEEVNKFFQANRKADWCAIIKSKSGRRIIGELLFKVCKVFSKNDFTELTVMAKQEGVRQVGNHILSLVLEFCPGEFEKIINEYKNVEHDRIAQLAKIKQSKKEYE